MSYYLDLFEEIVERFRVPATIVATTLENTLKNLKREGYPVENVSEEQLIELFKAVSQDKISKEAIAEVIKYLSHNPETTVNKAIEDLGLTKISVEELRIIVKEVIESNKERVAVMKERAYGMLMGRVMSKVRGKIDGRIVSDVVKEELAKFISKCDS